MGGTEEGRKEWRGRAATAVGTAALALGSVTLGWFLTHHDQAQQQARTDKASLVALHLQLEAADGYLRQAQRQVRPRGCSLRPIPTIAVPDANSAAAIAALTDGKVLFNVEIGEAVWEAFVAEYSDLRSPALTQTQACTQLEKAVDGTLTQVNAGLASLNGYLINRGL